jgi:hypothetical protein
VIPLRAKPLELSTEKTWTGEFSIYIFKMLEVPVRS